MYLGIALVVLGIILTNVSGSLTKRFIRKNNPEAASYSASQMKLEWQRVAREGGVVPSWVSLLSIGGWIIAIVGVVMIVRQFL